MSQLFAKNFLKNQLIGRNFRVIGVPLLIYNPNKSTFPDYISYRWGMFVNDIILIMALSVVIALQLEKHSCNSRDITRFKVLAYHGNSKYFNQTFYENTFYGY